jgi:hypothetical protein
MNLSKAYGFTLAASQPVWGQDAPNGFAVSLGIQAHFGGTGADRPRDPHTMTPNEYGKANQGFVNYTFEGQITRTNDRLNIVRINKGSKDGVLVGQVFDIFSVRPDGSVHEAIARARCTTVRESEAELSVTEFFKEVLIEEKDVVKRPLQ